MKKSLKYLAFVIVGLVIASTAFLLHNSNSEPASAGTTHFSGVTVQEDGLVVEDGGDITFGSGSDLSVGGTLGITGVSTLTGQAKFDGGILQSSTFATSSAASADFLAANIIGINSILVTPSTAVTLGLPATTTLASFVPNAGDRVSIAIVNASASTNLTIAGGTGTLLKNASTTAVIPGGGVGLLEFVRKANTDIAVFFTPGA